MDFGLTGKVALVAAGSQGLGKAAAFGLAAEGATVAICSREPKALLTSAEEIESKTGSIVFPVIADLTNPADIQSLVSTVLKQFGAIHVLVNNAGGPAVAPFSELSDEEWENGFKLNLMSTVRLTRTVIPVMQRQRWGRIINITSIAAKQPLPDLILSSTLRPAILGLTKVLATRYAAEGILINSVCPGYFMTDKQRHSIEVRAASANLTPDEYLEDHLKDIPVGRYGDPAELAHLIVFLASERASYITGSIFSVDGGMNKGLL